MTTEPTIDTPTTTSPDTEQAEARLRRLEFLVEELVQRLDETTSPDPSDTDAGPKPLYANVEDWVTGYLLANISRPFGQTGLQRWYWCEQWWRHNEAVTTLTALWYAWEHARLEPTGMIGWLHELHHHLSHICGSDGPFRECAMADGDRSSRHRPDEVANTVPAPAIWWDWWDKP
jgi:hypothetical protein